MSCFINAACPILALLLINVPCGGDAAMTVAIHAVDRFLLEFDLKLATLAFPQECHDDASSCCLPFFLCYLRFMMGEYRPQKDPKCPNFGVRFFSYSATVMLVPACSVRVKPSRSPEKFKVGLCSEEYSITEQCHHRVSSYILGFINKFHLISLVSSQEGSILSLVSSTSFILYPWFHQQEYRSDTPFLFHYKIFPGVAPLPYGVSQNLEVRISKRLG
jgi:hypothetical protein